MFSNSIPGGWQSQEWPHRPSMSQGSCQETNRNKIMRLKKSPGRLTGAQLPGRQQLPGRSAVPTALFHSYFDAFS
ncbi:hypothetical protein [Bradyrhizobium sp. 2S1]|uniref:hypothetical protein n=1 Tax=Bradyrhizobium sp. 2S1 TaxID=1404429 RepID=UPI001594F5C1